ncbi:hypothetical protein LCGC14_2153280, partial [marine sediment metagenome]
MTLTSIHLENFQSHEETFLELSPGVNVIIGPSDSGKTSIVRALRWLTWNRPGGEAFRSSWGGDTSVTVCLDKTMVRRERKKNHNMYYIDDHVYEAFGSEVPSDVVKLLNLDSVNLQQQLDRPFLLDTPPGQVAHYLNEVAHLDVIDRALQRLAKWIRGIESDIRTHTSNQERLGEAQSSFDYLPNMEKTIERLEEQEGTLREKQDKHRKLGETIDQALRVNTKLDTIRPLLDLDPLVDVALEHRKVKRGLVKEASSLFDLTDRIGDVQTQQKRLKPLQELAPTVD